MKEIFSGYRVSLVNMEGHKVWVSSQKMLNRKLMGFSSYLLQAGKFIALESRNIYMTRNGYFV